MCALWRVPRHRVRFGTGTLTREKRAKPIRGGKPGSKVKVEVEPPLPNHRKRRENSQVFAMARERRGGGGGGGQRNVREQRKRVFGKRCSCRKTLREVRNEKRQSSSTHPLIP